jgi:hypothetical protein
LIWGDDLERDNIVCVARDRRLTEGMSCTATKNTVAIDAGVGV